MSVDPTVVIMGTLDTKSSEISYLSEVIRKMGVKTLLMDVNIGGEPAGISPDISAQEIAAAGGGDIVAIRASRDTGQVTPIMIKGAIIKALELHAAGRLDGIISIGGASGTAVGTTVMKGLPFGVPKFMLSSTASMPAYAASYIGTKDITIMHSVVDIAGLNDLLRDVLVRAGGAISGMALARAAAREPAGLIAAEGAEPVKRPRKPLVALTEFKFSEGCCKILRESLTARGYDVIAFHAQGIGDQGMDELIDQGWFDGVLDIVPSGLCEELLGGNRAAGPRRLLAAGERGIPMIVTPCGFDILSCGPLDRRERKDPLWTARGLAKRQLFVPDSFRVQARTSREEVREVARETAARLNKARGPVKFLIPRQGWSNLSVSGGALHNPENDLPLTEEMRRCLTSPLVELVELDMELNSAEFARIVLDKFEGMMNSGPTL